MKSRQEPPRFTEGSDVPAGVREALDAAIEEGPSAAALSRMERALAPVFSTAPSPSTVGSSPSASAAKGAGWTIGKATTLVAFACAAGGYGAWRWSGGAAEVPPPAPVYAPSVGGATTIAPAEAPAQASESPAPAEAKHERSRPSGALRPLDHPRNDESERAAPVSPPTTAPNAAAPSMTSQPSELALVKSARQALTSDPARSLALVAEARRRFPSGSLSEEVEFIEIEALKHLGRNDEARALEDQFRARHPSSMHGRTVRVAPSAGR